MRGSFLIRGHADRARGWCRPKLVALRAAQSGTVAEIAVVIIAWVIAAGLVFGLVPLFSRWRDRRTAASFS
jgi:hypothetical protein